MQVALVQSSMHDEVLTSVVGEHDDCSTEVGFEGIEFEKGKQIVWDSKQNYSYEDKEKRWPAGGFISFQGDHRLGC